ncbi:hypothetical protein PENSPDRAFT_134644 [Peniophora sp. CONT]|nr:hypothetical protein PENSPDRAFT_134644 [Peniophora sp. CONT]
MCSKIQCSNEVWPVLAATRCAEHLVLRHLEPPLPVSQYCSTARVPWSLDSRVNLRIPLLDASYVDVADDIQIGSSERAPARVAREVSHDPWFLHPMDFLSMKPGPYRDQEYYISRPHPELCPDTCSSTRRPRTIQSDPLRRQVHLPACMHIFSLSSPTCSLLVTIRQLQEPRS